MSDEIDDFTQTILYCGKRLKRQVFESLRPDICPDLFNRVHLLRIGRNAEQLDVGRDSQCL